MHGPHEVREQQLIQLGVLESQQQAVLGDAGGVDESGRPRAELLGDLSD